MEENSQILSLDDQTLSLDDYEFVIKCIYSNYKEYCKSWHSIKSGRMNLKSKQIRDVYNSSCGIDNRFLDYMHTFKDGLTSFYRKILLELDDSIDITDKTEFTGRVKSEESIRNKIYIKSKDQHGKFPINKCLNDLLGLRIIDKDYKNNINVLEKKILWFKEQGCSINNIYRDTKEGYKGYHIYFKDSNEAFPIELQIWDSENEKKNRELHVPYKQSYVKDIIKDYNKF